ncbi:phage adaptor protein [Persephonella sp.]
MLTYTSQRNLYGELTENKSSANLTLGDTLIDSFTRQILGKRQWHFLEKTATDTTTDGGQFYNTPYNFRKLLSPPTITVGNVTYTPKECPNRELWGKINAYSRQSNIPEWFYQFDDQIGFYPKTNAGDTITYPYLARHKKLSVADYTTGTINTATNGSTTITGSGTSWTSTMAGRWIMIDESSGGDGVWYEIASVANATTLELKKKYQGISISSGSASYTIGQVSLLPDGYQEIPVYFAVATYWSKDRKPDVGDRFKVMGQELLQQMIEDYGAKTTNVKVESEDLVMDNPNLFIEK